VNQRGVHHVQPPTSSHARGEQRDRSRRGAALEAAIGKSTLSRPWHCARAASRRHGASQAEASRGSPPRSRRCRSRDHESQRSFGNADIPWWQATLGPRLGVGERHGRRGTRDRQHVVYLGNAGTDHRDPWRTRLLTACSMRAGCLMKGAWQGRRRQDAHADAVAARIVSGQVSRVSPADLYGVRHGGVVRAVGWAPPASPPPPPPPFQPPPPPPPHAVKLSVDHGKDEADV